MTHRQITHVVDSLDPAKGGPPLVASRLAAAQGALGNKVRLVCSAEPMAMTRIDAMMDSLPHSENLQIDYVSLPNNWQIASKSGKSELDALILDSDIVHFHGVWHRMNRWGMTTALNKRVPYVVTPHGMLDPWCLSQKAWKKKIAMKLAYKKLLDSANFIHALNQDEKTGLKSLHLSCPIKTIPNGVFLQEFEGLPQPGTFYKEFPQLSDRPFVLFMSRLHYKKGLDYLAEAFERVAREIEDVCLVVTGPDDGAQEQFCEQIRTYGLDERVFLTGGLYGEKKLAALVDAQCFSLPSRQEGFSIVILESLACRTPVVISSECHFPEVATEMAGFVVPLEPPEIADKLILLLNDETLRAELGNRGRLMVEKQFTWEKAAEAALKCYDECLSSH